MRRPQRSEEWKRIAKFALVGGVNTGVDFVLFVALFYGLGWPLGWSQTVSYGAATLNSYALNRRWTFRAGGRGSAAELAKFAAVNAASFAAATGTLLALERLGWPAWLAKLGSVAASLAVNYAGARLWVFRRVRDDEVSPS